MGREHNPVALVSIVSYLHHPRPNFKSRRNLNVNPWEKRTLLLYLFHGVKGIRNHRRKVVAGLGKARVLLQKFTSITKSFRLKESASSACAMKREMKKSKSKIAFYSH